MPVHFDASGFTVLAVCGHSGCPWMELVSSADIARRAALDHVWRVHPTDLTAVDTLERWLKRHGVRRLSDA